jgi:hypothetical protein
VFLFISYYSEFGKFNVIFLVGKALDNPFPGKKVSV